MINAVLKVICGIVSSGRQSTGTGPAIQLTSPHFPVIIKPMAITRCPYCHAIIDENDKYCNNCGTQLLFSEDEEIEEEIPGEKIVDAEVEEKDYTVDEPEDEKRPAPAKDLDSEIDEELAQELREETEEMALDELVAEEARKAGEDDVTEEVILVDEIEAAEAAVQDGSAAWPRRIRPDRRSRREPKKTKKTKRTRKRTRTRKRKRTRKKSRPTSSKTKRKTRMSKKSPEKDERRLEPASRREEETGSRRP